MPNSINSNSTGPTFLLAEHINKKIHRCIVFVNHNTHGIIWDCVQPIELCYLVQKIIKYEINLFKYFKV